MSTHLAVLLPGRGYGVSGPVLHLPRLALEEAGAETVAVEYPAGVEVPTEAGRSEDFHRSVANQVASFIEDVKPQRVTFIAKSLGTVALAALPLEVTRSVTVDAIWLTPLFGREPVRFGAIAHAWPSLLVAGEADALHQPVHHEAVRRALAAASVVLPRADHSLEVAGDVRATLDGLVVLTEAVMAFAGHEKWVHVRHMPTRSMPSFEA